jgi:hypothetical protein
VQNDSQQCALDRQRAVAQRNDTLSNLDDEIAALEEHLAREQECCTDMHDTIKKMRARLAEMRRRTSASHTRSADSSSESGAQSHNRERRKDRFGHDCNGLVFALRYAPTIERGRALVANERHRCAFLNPEKLATRQTSCLRKSPTGVGHAEQ